MARVRITREIFLADSQGKTFADVAKDPAQPFDAVLDFFNDADRQRRMEESELHHDRPPLAGVVRELEALPALDRFLAQAQLRRNARFRQAIGVIVRMIMEGRGWQKTGRKGSLGVRATGAKQAPAHNTGGLAFWFIRAERYVPRTGAAYQSVRQRCQDLEAGMPVVGQPKAPGRRIKQNGQARKAERPGKISTARQTSRSGQTKRPRSADHGSSKKR